MVAFVLSPQINLALQFLLLHSVISPFTTIDPLLFSVKLIILPKTVPDVAIPDEAVEVICGFTVIPTVSFEVLDPDVTVKAHV